MNDGGVVLDERVARFGDSVGRDAAAGVVHEDRAVAQLDGVLRSATYRLKKPQKFVGKRRFRY